MVSAGTQHNVIPDKCEFTVDIRTTDAYTNEEIVETLSGLVGSQVRPRNMKRRASSIAADHPLVAAVAAWGWRLSVHRHFPTRHCCPVRR